MPRRYWVFLEGQGLDLFNFISTIGAFFMAAGTILFMYNIVWTAMKEPKASGDPWDGRTLEWAVSSPPPHYNFKQLPLVRGLIHYGLRKQKVMEKCNRQNRLEISICRTTPLFH